MARSHDMPCGNCCVCQEVVDHSDAGICATCGGVFHWNDCGSWQHAKHTCDACMEEPDDE